MRYLKGLGFFFFFLLLEINLYAQEKALVSAFNGLIVRDSPSTKGDKISKLPYGEVVEIITNTNKKFSVNEDGFVISGTWVQIKNDTSTKKSYVFDGFLKRLDEELDSKLKISFKEDDIFKEIYSVYQFKKGTYGIVIKNEGGLVFENEDQENYSLKYKEKGIVPAINDGLIAPLFEDKRVTENFNNNLNDYFYVYFEKGYQKIKPNKILFYVDEVGCTEDFVMLEVPIGNKKMGNPLLASKNYFPLNYLKDKKTSAHYNYAIDKNFLTDCRSLEDSSHIIVFAKYKEYYFSFRNQIDPYRNIFKITDKGFVNSFDGDLDLFGCGCL